AISARRVFPPVAVTVPSAVPLARNVPPKPPSPTCLATGSLSPESIDSSAVQLSADRKIRSAGRRSPAARSTTSPGTTAVASIFAGGAVADDRDLGGQQAAELVRGLGGAL